MATNPSGGSLSGEERYLRGRDCPEVKTCVDLSSSGEQNACHGYGPDNGCKKHPMKEEVEETPLIQIQQEAVDETEDGSAGSSPLPQQADPDYDPKPDFRTVEVFCPICKSLNEVTYNANKVDTFDCRHCTQQDISINEGTIMPTLDF